MAENTNAEDGESPKFRTLTGPRVEGWPATGLQFPDDAPSELFGFPQEIEAEPDGAHPIPLEAARRTLARVERHMVDPAPAWPRPSAETALSESTSQTRESSAILNQMFTDADAAARLRAIEALEDETGDDALELLLQAVMDNDRQVRDAAVALLEEQDPRKLTRRILELLAAGGPQAQAALDQALPALRAHIEEPAIRILADDNLSATEHTWAAYMLGRMKSADAIHLLAERLWAAQNTQLMIVCAKAIANNEDTRAQPYLAQMAGHSHPAVRRAAIHGLAGLGGSQAVSIISNIAAGPQESDTNLREEAITLLAYMGDDRAVPALIQVLQQRPQLRAAAAGALRELTGQPFGTDITAWIQWYQEVIAQHQQMQPGPGQQHLQPQHQPQR